MDIKINKDDGDDDNDDNDDDNNDDGRKEDHEDRERWGEEEMICCGWTGSTLPTKLIKYRQQCTKPFCFNMYCPSLNHIFGFAVQRAELWSILEVRT